LQADPNADARSVVGEQAARNNPTFFKGRPTVAKVLERYTEEMNRRTKARSQSPVPAERRPKAAFVLAAREPYTIAGGARR
jgi:hypothetical protein